MSKRDEQNVSNLCMEYKIIMAIIYGRVNPTKSDDNIFDQLEELTLDYDVYKKITIIKLSDDYVQKLKLRLNKVEHLLHEHYTFKHWNDFYRVVPN